MAGFDIGVVPKSAVRQTLYTVAYNCAQCGGNHCANCDRNPEHMGYDLNEVRFIKAQAAIDWQRKLDIHEDVMAPEKPMLIGGIIFLVAMLVFVFIDWLGGV